MLKFFPISARAKDLKGLLISILIYIVVSILVGLGLKVLAILPLIDILLGIIGWLVELYIAVGVVISILVFLKIVKK